MKLYKAIFLSSLILFSQLSWAWGESCPESDEVQVIAEEDEQKEFQHLLGQLDKDFQMWHGAAQESITKSIECLLGTATQGDCQDRMDYFFNTLPNQLRLYRQNLALSRWGGNFFGRVFRDKIDAKSPYNMKLKISGSFYRGHVQPPPIEKGSDEHLEIQEIFDRKIEVAFKQALDEMKPEDYKLLSGEEFERQKRLVENRDLQAILVDPLANNSARLVTKTFANRVFELNHRRMIKQLVTHPILAMLKSREVTTEALIVALKLMEDNLAEEVIDINKRIEKVNKKFENPNTKVLSRDFYHLLEYTTIAEGLVHQDPSLCPIVKHVDKIYSRSQWVKIGAIGAALVGVIAATFVFSIPVMVLVGGSVAVEGFIIYDTNDEVSQVTNRSFMSPEEALNQADSKDVYSASEDLKTEVVFYAPMALIGVPLLKVGKVFKYLRAKK